MASKNYREVPREKYANRVHDCDRLCRHGLLCLPLDGGVPGTNLLIHEVAVKTRLLLTLFLLAIPTSFVRSAESNGSFMAYAVFYVS